MNKKLSLFTLFMLNWASCAMAQELNTQLTLASALTMVQRVATPNVTAAAGQSNSTGTDFTINGLTVSFFSSVDCASGSLGSFNLIHQDSIVFSNGGFMYLNANSAYAMAQNRGIDNPTVVQCLRLVLHTDSGNDLVALSDNAPPLYNETCDNGSSSCVTSTAPVSITVI